MTTTTTAVSRSNQTPPAGELRCPTCHGPLRNIGARCRTSECRERAARLDEAWQEWQDQ